MDLIRHSLVSFDVEERHRVAAKHRMVHTACSLSRSHPGITARIGRLLIAVGSRLEATARAREPLSRPLTEEPNWR